MRILILTIFALALSGPVVAQPADETGADPHHPGSAADAQVTSPEPRGMMQMVSGMNCPMMGGHTEGALAFLKTELKITQAQRAAWDKFAAAYRDIAASHQEMAKKRRDMMGSGGMMGGSRATRGGKGPHTKGTMSYPDRLNSQMHMMEERMAAMGKVHEAVRPLYAALNDGQRKTADQLLPMFTMMGGMM